MKASKLEELATSFGTMLNVKGIVGYKIARNLRMINDELMEYYQFKQELFRKYGEEINGSLVINKDSENFEHFMLEMKPIMEQEIDLPLKKIKEDELADSGLTAGQMGLIWDIVEE